MRKSPHDDHRRGEVLDGRCSGKRSALTGTATRVLTASSYLATLMFSMRLELGGEREDWHWHWS
jgi:hypothetical protein